MYLSDDSLLRENQDPLTCWSHLFGPLTGCYAPAVPAGDTSKRSAQAYGTPSSICSTG